MKLVEIRGESEFHELRPAWDALLRESGASIFLTWEWVSAWWSAYGKRGDLRILTAWDEKGALRGIAPLRAQTIRRYGQTVSALSYIGDGSNDSDYLDLIIAAGDEDRVFEAFRGRLREELRAGVILQLNEIEKSSRSLPLLKQLADAEKSIWVEREVPCATVRLPENWEDYLGELRPRFRTKVRSVLRNLEGREEVRFGFCESTAEILELLPKLFDLHGRRWAKDGKPGVFGWECKRDFYFRLSPLLLERGWLRLSWLEWNGRLLASQYGFIYGDAYFQLQEGYEQAAEQLNLGIGLRAWSIREFLRQGIREYDFLGGVTRSKTDWGAGVKHSKQILIADDTWKNALVCRGPEWELRARESVARKLPKKVRSARTAWLLRERGAHAVSNGERLRKAAAKCYYYSPLPRLMRPLRERYQLTLGTGGAAATNGTRRAISWQKRGQPAARILYYHRVDDEQDPFFPAISSSLFEQEMRYVARNYKVVSVSELLDRLQGGATEPVLAITFDDGYQDNYRNAFPILQRYGLPATIFLSTGSLDSRQPLWFEELADALKRTTREYVDLEIGFPRRFFLRTESDRLESNGEIFLLLRRMNNSERKEWLAEILRQAGVPENGERRNRMLTWDQVREMKKRQIDFGGHTVTHPFISRLTQDEVRWEISECKRRIEEELQHTVDYFAYPNGREEDFGLWNKDILRGAGYRAAMTTIWGLNYASTDPMELRRGGPWEESAAQFACKLDWYQWVNE